MNFLIGFLFATCVILLVSVLLEPRRKRLKWQEPFYKDGSVSSAGYLMIAQKLREENHNAKD
mgnify:CR=1 FL=1